MRLTLRTLLAYLDHTLDPADEASLKEKIQTSTIASTLVGRIRSVLRTRSVGAPAAEAAAPNDDANTVAEYLDSTLAPELTADVERRCLESEAHLAEVAASHQVLAAALAEPTTVPASLRRRVYELRPAESTGGENGNHATEPGQSELTRTAGVVTPVGPEDSGVSDATTRLSEDPDLSATLAVAAKSIRKNRRTETRLSEANAGKASAAVAGVDDKAAIAGSKSRRQLEDIEPFLSSGRSSRVVPYLVSLALAAAFLFVLSQAFKPFLKSNSDKLAVLNDAPSDNDANVDGTVTSDASTNLIPSPKPSGNTTPAKDANPTTNDSTATVGDAASENVPVVSEEPLQPEEQSNRQTSDNGAETGRDENAVPPDSTSPPASNPPTVREITDQPEANDRSAEFSGSVTQNDLSGTINQQGPPSLDNPAMLLDSVSESDADNSADLSEEAIAIGGVQNHGGLLLTQSYDQQTESYQWGKIAPDSKIFSGQTIVCPPTFRSRLVFDGGVELTLVGPAGVRVEKKRELGNRLGLTIDYGRVTLMTTGGESSIWIATPVVTGWLELGGSGAMVAMEIEHRRLPGQSIEHSSWKTDLRIDSVAGKVGLRLLDDEEPGNAAVLKLAAGQRLQQTFGQAAELRNVAMAPNWIDAPSASSERQAITTRKSLVDLLDGDDPVEFSLIRAAGYRDLKVASLAARTLASMGVSYLFFGTSDDIGPPGLLNQPEHKSNWPELVDALRSLFERGENTAEGIAYVATLREGEEDAAKLITMLQGFTQKELAEGGAAFLVAWLDDPKLAVRVMAIETLRQMTGETFEYKAELETPNQRRAAVNRWKAAVKNDRVKYQQ